MYPMNRRFRPLIPREARLINLSGEPKARVELSRANSSEKYIYISEVIFQKKTTEITVFVNFSKILISFF